MTRLLCATALLALLPGCGFERVGGRTMGTGYLVEARCPGALPVEAVAATLDEVVVQASTWQPDSELSAFNERPVGVVVPVSQELADLASAALAVAEESGGAFDPTVGPLVSLWGFGADAAQTTVTATALAAARAQVGHWRLRVHDSPPGLEKLAPLDLDLSALAKGHAVDQAARALEEAGCRDYLVELGGEVRTSGSSPSGGRWRISVDSPTADGSAAAVLRIGEAAVATSGDYRQFRYGRDGKRLSHIVDPRTGRPVAHRLASATVVAATARQADAYATALMVLGEEEGARFAERRGVAALFIVREADEFAVRHTPRMAEYLR